MRKQRFIISLFIITFSNLIFAQTIFASFVYSFPQSYQLAQSPQSQPKPSQFFPQISQLPSQYSSPPPQSSQPPQSSAVSPVEPDAWKYFYIRFRPFADVRCAKGSTALEKVTNCIIAVTKALQYLAVFLFVLALTYSAGLLVFSPFKKDAIENAKKIIIWSIVGFIILFTAEQIMKAIQWLGK